jgi:hypothetical protein
MTPNPKPVHIEARRWFQRTYGNTYHSVRVHQDGVVIYSSGRTYGYGEQWLQTACEWLAENGYPALAERYDNGMRKHCHTQYLREVLKSSYSVADVARERDL